jgi:hypothetical protein
MIMLGGKIRVEKGPGLKETNDTPKSNKLERLYMLRHGPGVLNVGLGAGLNRVEGGKRPKVDGCTWNPQSFLSPPFSSILGTLRLS